MTCKQLDLIKVDEKSFKRCFVGCIVLTKDHKIMLQQRGSDGDNYPGYLSEFGGSIEANETPMQALIRELNEELGAIVHESDVVCLGAITEEITNHTELVYVYFWQDKDNSITGCYEGEAKYFDDVPEIIKNKKIMDSVRWLLSECQALKLI